MTQLQAALAGQITPAMEQVAKAENRTPEWVRDQVAAGLVVIPKNINHNFVARGVGKGLKTKVNANIGTSEEHCNLAEEIKKLKVAVDAGADSVMDLSTAGKLDFARTSIIENSPVMVGTVPIYSVITELVKQGKGIEDMTADMLFDELEKQGQQGVDFFTVHTGITQRSVSFLLNSKRLMGVVSRGGSLTKRWMLVHDKENPLAENFDRLLEICKKYDVTLSLGDSLRPGAQFDAGDRGQIAELLVLGEQVDKARAAGVQVMVEGPGHVPLAEVAAQVQIQKKVCHDAPFYVLGPLVTDAASGYDHIAGAIGGAIAASHGADFLCYVTPAEHLCLPNEDDVRRGVVASLIAAHAGDIAKEIPGAINRDHAISKARREFDWETIYNLSLDPVEARKRREESEAAGEEHCTMCGSLCAVKTDTKPID